MTDSTPAQQPLPLPRPVLRDWRRPWRQTAAALVLGGAGGWLFFRLHVPLGFLIGALVFTTTAALCGLRLGIPVPLRSTMVAILGIMLGSAFTPDPLDRVGAWTVSLAGLLAYTLVAGAIGLLYLRRVARYDPVTAFFTAMPGGINEMVLQGEAHGGDARIIALGHSLRIVLTVLVVPVAFSTLPGFAAADRDWSLGGLGPGLAELPAMDWLLLAACGLAAPVAKRLGIPAGLLVGPMLASAAIHLAGLTAAKPPGLPIALAQIVVGAAIGTRFVGVPVATVLRVLLVALGLTGLLLAVTMVVAAMLHLGTGLDYSTLVLAYAPGGLAEMSLIALSLRVDSAFVATHHIARIVIIVVFAPLLWRIARPLLHRDAVIPPRED